MNDFDFYIAGITGIVQHLRNELAEKTFNMTNCHGIIYNSRLSINEQVGIQICFQIAAVFTFHSDMRRPWTLPLIRERSTHRSMINHTSL